MCFCCHPQRHYKLQLEVLNEYGKIERQPYVIDVEPEERSVCCCLCDSGVNELHLNNQQTDEKIYDNVCFPLCCKGGDFEWQDRGHYFRLEMPSMYIHDGLYVDGKEINSRRYNQTEWRCQFAVWLIVGLLMLAAGIAFIVLHYLECCWSGFLYLGISCVITAVLAIVPGIIGCCRIPKLNHRYDAVQKAQAKLQDNENFTRI